MIVRPLNLEAALRKPSPHFPVLAFVDVVVLMFAFGIFGSSLVTSPSLTLDLELPEAVLGDHPEDWGATWHDEVLTVTHPAQVFFRGQSLAIGEVGTAVRRSTQNREEVTLLLRMDRDLPLSRQIEVLEQLRLAGVARVRVAVQNQSEEGWDGFIREGPAGERSPHGR